MSEQYMENENYRKMQRMVDYLCRKIENKSIDKTTVDKAALRIREVAQKHFPDKMDTFDMIYISRFNRLCEQYLEGGNAPR